MNDENKIILDMWMARDKYLDENNLCIGYLKPERAVSAWCNFGDFLPLPDFSFKHITWENEPVKVKVTIEIVEENEYKNKKKGSRKETSRKK